MTPPTPTRTRTQAPERTNHPATLHGATEEWGPLVRQPPQSARLARILHHAAQELWDACTLPDSAQMWEEARAVASRILASSPGD